MLQFSTKLSSNWSPKIKAIFKRIFFLRDNTVPRKVAITHQKLAHFHFKVQKHPDLAPSDYITSSMDFAGYVAICVQLYCRCFPVLRLVSSFIQHVSAYTAIFRCVGCFYFRIPEGICFTGFTCTWLHFALFHLCFPVLFSSLILLFLACTYK
jgi:hypothetical protein